MGISRHVFGQQARDGGFRPVVFLGPRAGGGVLRNDDRCCRRSALANTNQNSAAACRSVSRRTWAGCCILCKSLASLVYGAVLVPMVRFAKPQLQVRLAMILAAIVFSYPLLRTADLVPTEVMLDAARSVDDRSC